MATVDATDANFETVVLQSEVPVIVDMWAEWCAPCRMIEPYLDEISDDYSEKVLVARVDIDSSPGIAVRYGARSIPMLLFIKHGQVVDKLIGAVPKKQMLKKLLPLME
ncbi:thioredoxin [bacterium BMS3Abin05]|nr:thioredoxin [bacterium BMS3Abin05]GBE27705.1 thioredoxin [bacterium BMS3Bbin03]